MGWASYEEDNVSRFHKASELVNNPYRNQVSGAPNRDRGEEAPVSARPERHKSLSLSRTLGGSPLPEARPLPVILMLDVSGSMHGGKMDSLNRAVSDMIRVFASEEGPEVEIQVCIVTFGGSSARVHVPPTPASQVRWTPMAAAGETPFSHLFRKVRDLLEDSALFPSTGFTPCLVLCSDGQPNKSDPWQDALSDLLQAPRASKAQRLALAIEMDEKHQVLQAFLADENAKVRYAEDAASIPYFFNYLTMSVLARSRSTSPNTPVPLSYDDEERYRL